SISRCLNGVCASSTRNIGPPRCFGGHVFCTKLLGLRKYGVVGESATPSSGMENPASVSSFSLSSKDFCRRLGVLAYLLTLPASHAGVLIEKRDGVKAGPEVSARIGVA